MKLRVHNTDRLVPQAILESPGVAHYFSDTKMSVRNLQVSEGYFRVLVNPLFPSPNQGDCVERIVLDFAETPRERLAEEMDRILGRFPRAAECFKSLSRLPWVMNPSGENWDAFHTKKGGVVFIKNEIRSDLIYNPFARFEPLTCLPKQWDTNIMVSALHNGQFTRVSSIATESAALIEGGESVCAQKLEPIEGRELALMMIENRWLNWTVSPMGKTPCAAVTIVGRPKEAYAHLPEVRFEVEPDLFVD